VTVIPQKSNPKNWYIAGAVAALALLFAIGMFISGELGSFVLASIQTLPFMLLAVLAYVGVRYTWGKVLTLVWLGLLVASTGLVVLVLSFAALGNLVGATPGDFSGFNSGDGARLLAIAVLGFVAAVRRSLARFLPIDPNSFVHMVALVAVVALTLLCFLPLLILAEPPFLTLFNNATEQGVNLTEGQDEAAQLRSTVYGLVWTVPGTILAVGYGVQRKLRPALERLGLVRPTLKQVLLGIATAVVLVGAVQVLGHGINWLWEAMGWPATDGEAFGELMAFAFNPLGAVVIGITAGLGEELAVRGVLQPRLGILLSNLFFTGLHAFQYNWDSLLVVFLVGLAMGFLRKRTNTTTSAIAHGVYDFLLIMAFVLEIPGFTE